MNKDSGPLFQARARELLEYIKSQPAPYHGTDSELARALFIGHRSIARYLHFLKGIGRIEMVTTQSVKLNAGWVNRRKIVIKNQEA